MTAAELSLEFDLLYNNICSNQAPGLNEYEKSLILTEAQEALILDLYSGKLGSPFEDTEEITDYLSSLVKQVNGVETTDGFHIYETSKLFKIPEKIWFKTHESASIKDTDSICESNIKTVEVVPVTQDTLYKTVNSPFRGANSRRVLRLDQASKTEDGFCQVVELISKYDILSYTVRYIEQPHPIILEDLSDTGLTINGEDKVHGSDLHPALHRSILSRAANIAKLLWASNPQ